MQAYFRFHKIASCLVFIALLSQVLSHNVEKLSDSEFGELKDNSIKDEIINKHDLVNEINGQPINKLFTFKNNPYKNDNNSTRPPAIESWGFGLISGLVIILCSACGLVLTPLTKKPWYKKLLLYLVSTATASLLGNALFQLIPPAYGIEVDISDEENIWKSAAIYLSFCTFFVIERVLRLVFEEPEDEEEEGSEKYKVKAEENLALVKSRAASRLSMNVVKGRAGSTLGGMAISGAISAGELLEERNNQDNESNQSEENLTLWERMRKVKMFAWMLFIGDALENIADGMAMGAAFGQSIALGIGITIAIFSEELPHKVGDFAIFLNAGMSVPMALSVNLVSGATVWIGLVIGLIASDDPEVTMFIFAIAGGVFLYVGLGGLFPEMGEISEELQEEGYNPWKCLAIELAGLGTGLAMMLVLCYFREDIETAFE